MSPSQTQCPVHGREGIGLLCGHIAFAVDRGERLGFFWGDDNDTAGPDAWCVECEKKLRGLNGASSEQWFPMLISNAGMRPNHLRRMYEPEHVIADPAKGG